LLSLNFQYLTLLINLYELVVSKTEDKNSTGRQLKRKMKAISALNAAISKAATV
jgi:hypothetical protein